LLRETTGRSAIIILLIMTLVAMNIMITIQLGYGSCDYDENRETSILMMDATHAQQMNFSADTLTVAAGGQVVPMLTVEPQSSTETIVWTSSDESVAGVTQSGTITAYRSGEAVITASGKNCSATVNIVVTSDIFAKTSEMIKELSVHAADITVFNRATELKDQLGRCTEEGAVQLFELMDRILAFSTGNGDSALLLSSISAMPNASRICCRLSPLASSAAMERPMYRFTGE